MRTVKIAYTPLQRRSLGEKLRYKLAVRRNGGPVWARIRDTRQMVRRYPGHNSRRERICQDDFFNFSKLNKPAEKKSS